MQGHAAPLLASKTVLDPRATLHTIRERHGEAPLRLSLLFSTWSPLTSRGALLDRERRHEERLKLVSQRLAFDYHKRFRSQEIDESSRTCQRIL